MNLFLFLLVIVILILVVRIGAAAFELTGMQKKTAFFQSISCLTNTGFTTPEAELVTHNDQRRKIASCLMIFGNAGLVTLIITFANTIINPTKIFDTLGTLSDPLLPSWLSQTLDIAIIILGVYLVYIIIAKAKFTENFISWIQHKILAEKIIQPEKVSTLYFTDQDFCLAQFIVSPESSLINKSIRKLNLKDAQIEIMLLKRDGEIIGMTKEDLVLLANDTLTCFGKLTKIQNLANI
ncbi:MAG: TrkA C-terminal domain-containing protein [Candidatus Saganbacteria bacterium]|nr:TrkA C-terminal domain-containing protein [Candidatus Saganbacteria bacterium]